jgi:hypothetical protein
VLTWLNKKLITNQITFLNADGLIDEKKYDMKYLISKLLLILQTIKREIMVGTGLLILNLQALAQEEGGDGGGDMDVDLNVDDGGGGAWFYNWWIWVGLALFVIIIIAIVSAGRRR